jgi:predicted anti-sigma-YlaC factor YlaD
MFRGAPVAINLWFEHVIDAFLEACAAGRDWRAAVAEAERRVTAENRPRRVLTQAELRTRKGLRYSRQHLARRVIAGTMPPPFQLPDSKEG